MFFGVLSDSVFFFFLSQSFFGLADDGNFSGAEGVDVVLFFSGVGIDGVEEEDPLSVLSGVVCPGELLAADDDFSIPLLSFLSQSFFGLDEVSLPTVLSTGDGVFVRLVEGEEEGDAVFSSPFPEPDGDLRLQLCTPVTFASESLSDIFNETNRIALCFRVLTKSACVSETNKTANATIAVHLTSRCRVVDLITIFQREVVLTKMKRMERERKGS